MTTRSVLCALLISVLAASATAAPKKNKKKKATPAKTAEPVEPVAEPEPTPTDAKAAGQAQPGTSGQPGIAPAQPGTAPSTPTPPADATVEEKPPEDVPGDADVDALRQEYLKLRDELFKSRARANTVASQLYSTRIQIKLTYTTARYYNPAKASIRLDGASVYEDASGAIAGDDGIRFDGYVAPGRHLITFRVEATGKDDDSFTSVTETQIVVKAVAGKDLVVGARAKDSGDIAYEWKRGESGSYGLGIDTSVRTIARAGEKKASK